MWLLLASAALCAAPAVAADADDPPPAQEDAAGPEQPTPDLDALIEGFEDDEEFLSRVEEPLEEPPSAARDRFWDLTGDIALGLSYNYLAHRSPGTETPYGGLSRLQLRLRLELDLDLPASWKIRVAGRGFYDLAYELSDRDRFTEEVIDLYEDELDFQEVWIEGSLLPSLDLKLGRQIETWGRSDNLRVLDVLNPLDLREPGLVDIQDLRRPIAMAKLTWYRGPWSLSSIVIPEVRFDKNPVFGSDFFPLAAPLPREEIPDDLDPDAFEYALALTGIFPGWDISFHAARLNDDRPHVELDDAGLPVLQHGRIAMFGAGGNYTLGNFLLKGEIAWLDGLDFFTARDRARLDVLVGVEYHGLRDATATLEVANRYIPNFEPGMRGAPDFAEQSSTEISAAYVASLINARLFLSAVLVAFGSSGAEGGFLRLAATYELRESLALGVGIVPYWTGDDFPFAEIGRNDRLFAELTYSF